MPWGSAHRGIITRHSKHFWHPKQPVDYVWSCSAKSRRESRPLTVGVALTATWNLQLEWKIRKTTPMLVGDLDRSFYGISGDMQVAVWLMNFANYHGIVKLFLCTTTCAKGLPEEQQVHQIKSDIIGCASTTAVPWGMPEVQFIGAVST